MKKTLQLVHDNELETLLASLGLEEKINESKLKCKFCKEAVTSESIHSIFPEAGSIKVVCDKVECIKALTFFLNSDKLESKEG
jgi:hypothetical protein